MPKKLPKFTKAQIGTIDGGTTAMALCGYAPFGDCQSIRYRLDWATAKMKSLKEYLVDMRKHMPEDVITKMWEHEVEIWEYVIPQGEKLLSRELKNPQSR